MKMICIVGDTCQTCALRSGSAAFRKAAEDQAASQRGIKVLIKYPSSPEPEPSGIHLQLAPVFKQSKRPGNVFHLVDR